MEKFTHFIGIDVSKSTFHVALIEGENLIGEWVYENNSTGIDAFSSMLKIRNCPSDQVLICLEHCGVYMEKLCQRLTELNLFVWALNPLIAKHAFLDLNRQKTDRKDAEALARLAQLYWPKATAYLPPNQLFQDLNNLFLLRKQLVKKRQQGYNFLASNADKAAPCQLAKEFHQEVIEILARQIKTVEKQMLQLIKDDPRLKQIFQILLSIPTIGKVSALHLICLTQGFTKFTSHKKLAAYIGTAPFEFSSGSSVKRKTSLSPRANKGLKTNLTMGAIGQINPKRVFYQYYIYMKEEQHKHHLWIINSIRNIVLKLAFKLVERNQQFDLNIFLKNKKSWHIFLDVS